MNDKPVFDPDRDRAFRAMIVENARAEKSRPSLRARATLLIGLVLAAVLVSGGGVAMALTGIIWIPVAAPAPVETPSATPTPTPTPTATSAPAPAPDPEPAVVDVSSWIIGFDGVGPIAFGGPMTDASASLDTTDLVKYDFGMQDCPADYRQLPAVPRSYVGVDPDEAGVYDPAVGVVIRIEVSNYPTDDDQQLEAALPRTAEGISTGSTRAELVAAYPDLVEDDPVAGDAIYSLTDASGHWLWFRVADETGTVIAIDLTDRSEYTVGGCAD